MRDVEPIVPCADTSLTEFRILGVEEYPPAESRNHGGEVDGSPYAVYVHVVHASVNVIATWSHLVETEGLKVLRWPAPRYRVHSRLGEALPFEFPNFMAERSLNNSWSLILELGR
jgi:hypothetical protein